MPSNRLTPLVALLLALAASGCGADSTRRNVCDPGTSDQCFCDDGRSGLALCDDDGRPGPCSCGADTADDVDIDVPDPPDVGRPDASTDAGRDDAGCERPLLLYPDEDGDGHGASDGTPVRSCVYLPGYSASPSDCNDADRTIFPTAPELCDGIDNDCNGAIDDGVEERDWWPDLDDDGYGDPEGEVVRSCAPVPGHAPNDGDCDDERDDVSPAAVDLCDGIDSDCDGEVDEAAEFTIWYRDADGDGYGDASGIPARFCAAPPGFVANRRDCDDSRADINPDATEICNFADDDCDGVVDDGVDLLLLWPDTDSDTFGDMFGAPIYSCEPLPGYVANDTDCNDRQFTINPLALERCNGVDDDCNGLIDDGASGTRTFYPDADGDGYGVSTGPVQACFLPRNHAERGGDCNDAVASTNPGASEVCDGVDNDCDGAVDEGVANRCGGCGPEPAEVCGNFVDDDCDGAIDEAEDGCFCDGRTNQPCYTGAPATLGIGVCRGGTISCQCPGGARFCTDGVWGACAGQVLPQTEICDGIDNDCDGRVDEGLRNACGACGPTPVEICDGIDNDCDGAVDEFVRLPCGVCPGEEGTEICGNGLDDDCDGLVDQGCSCRSAEEACYPGPPATRGVGACRDGARYCYATAEGPSACRDAVLPSIELCDGIDNDCDGRTDVDARGCSVCGTAEEICNGVDDDCDGQIDEGLRNACGDCLISVVPEESRGLAFCNGVDDDCDGFVDEGLINACGTCDEACYVDGWSTDAGFAAGGTGDGISPNDGLRLDTSSFTFADLWVANSGADTVTRINTNTGAVVGTYPVGIHAGTSNDSPSRTAVDLDGNAWVANRALGLQGSVTKIRGGDCVTGCVMFNVAVGVAGGLPRGLAIDRNNDVWVGLYNEERIYHLDGDTGATIASYSVGPGAHPYGLVIDGDGVIWIPTISDGRIVPFDTRTNTVRPAIVTAAWPYGIAVDGSGNVWFATYNSGPLGRIDRAAWNAGSTVVTYHGSGSGVAQTRGVAVDGTGNVWTADSSTNRIYRFSPSGAVLGSTPTCSAPIGIGVASDGNVWTMCYNSNQAQRFSATGAFVQTVAVGAQPYSYSDMTGFALRAFTARNGTWTQTWDCGFATCGFERIRWTATVPGGTTLSVRARSRLAGGPWSAWTDPFTSSPAEIGAIVPDGRFLEVQVSMTTSADRLTPVLRSLDVEWQRP